MDTIKQFKEEFAQEYAITKSFFELFPDGKNEYAPHEKSSKQMPLAIHIAEVFGWPELMLKTSRLDFDGSDYVPSTAEDKASLIDLLEENYEKGKRALEEVNDEKILDEEWSLGQGDITFASWSKYGAIRHALNQITHHRAQLGVYYRLQNIELPSSYGPTADVQEF